MPYSTDSMSHQVAFQLRYILESIHAIGPREESMGKREREGMRSMAVKMEMEISRHDSKAAWHIVHLA